MKTLLRLVLAIPVAIAALLCAAAAAAAMLIADVLYWLNPREVLPVSVMPNTQSASVVIPNWNGKDLLAKYIPPLLEAMAGHADNEIIVVDNGSSDGSAQFLRDNFPRVKVLALEKNLGFGGGSNAGFNAARNDVVVLLNSDMRVEREFLEPLLNGFTDAQVFAVSCQIFLSDPAKRREETGLTEGWWENGRLWVGHRIDDKVTGLFPCFYGGGGSCGVGVNRAATCTRDVRHARYPTVCRRVHSAVGGARADTNSQRTGR